MFNLITIFNALSISFEAAKTEAKKHFTSLLSPF